MEESQLVRAIEAHEANAETYGNLQDERVEALDYYLGNPMGNEVEGRSQVIARQVWDTVEWLKPQLADIFCSGEEVVSFSPIGPEDIGKAQQETDYVNHIITQRNPWFEIFNGWSHDALVQKNGYVKAYWDDGVDLAVERYQDLTQDEYALLTQSKDVEVVEHEETQTYIPEAPFIDIRHSCTVKRAKPRNTVKLENLAPESIRVDHNARSVNLQDERVSFVQHAEHKTLSDLRQEGFEVDDDLMDSGDGVGDWENDLRDEYSPFRDREGNESDPSMRRVKVRESWIRVDYDGDGMAELRHVIVVGTTVLLNEEADFIPIVAMCPIPLPHQHYGQSVADAVMDLQKIQTALLRGALDNQYLANNGRYAVDQNAVNLDDMLDSRPGGIVRVNGQPGAAMFPLTHPTNGQVAIPMMEYVDKLAQKRTGVNEQTQGLDPNALNKTATGATMLMTAAQQRIKFIARVFAETGVRALFSIVHALTLKHSRQQEIMELRGNWVPVDPRTWVKRKDLVVNVALGQGDRMAQMAFLSQVLQIQKEAVQIGLTTPEKVYNTLSRLTRAGGYKDPDEFWNNPKLNPPPKQEPPPDPRVVVEQMRQQSDVMRFQVESQMTQQIEMLKVQAQQEKSRLELEVQAANDARDSERAQLEAQMKAQIEQMRAQNEEQIALMRDATERYKADLASQTQILIKQMELGADPQTQEKEAGEKAERDGRDEAFAQALQAIQQGNEASVQGLMNRIDQASTQMAQMVSQLQAAMNSPREIVRGPDGKAVGVRVNGAVRPVNRGPDGRVAGV